MTEETWKWHQQDIYVDVLAALKQIQTSKWDYINPWWLLYHCLHGILLLVCSHVRCSENSIKPPIIPSLVIAPLNNILGSLSERGVGLGGCRGCTVTCNHKWLLHAVEKNYEYLKFNACLESHFSHHPVGLQGKNNKTALIPQLRRDGITSILLLRLLDHRFELTVRKVVIIRFHHPSYLKYNHSFFSHS